MRLVSSAIGLVVIAGDSWPASAGRSRRLGGGGAPWFAGCLYGFDALAFAEELRLREIPSAEDPDRRRRRAQAMPGQVRRDLLITHIFRAAEQDHVLEWHQQAVRKKPSTFSARGMSLEIHPEGKPIGPSNSQTWGELSIEGETASVVRFVLEQGTVSIPVIRFTRWEHTRATPETILIHTGEERILVEGRDLSGVCAAMDMERLRELRVNVFGKASARPGPQIRRITIEPA